MRFESNKDSKNANEEWLYYIASPDNATQRYLYRSRLDGTGTAERLTPASQPGWHAYNVSPDFHWALHIYSTIDTPPVVELIRFPDQHLERTLEDNAALRAKMKATFTQSTEFLKVDAGDAVLDGWMIKPENFDATKKYPVLVFVYGEPAAQTVVDHWGGEQELFHRYIAKEGYAVSYTHLGAVVGVIVILPRPSSPMVYAPVAAVIGSAVTIVPVNVSK